MSDTRVAVVGGGAAGLVAAIASARAGACVTLLEAESRVGRKILASGNGRCNLSNTGIAPDAYNAPDFVAPMLAEFPCEAVVAFFTDLGLLTYADDEGRVYPVTNAANSVLDVLRLECAHLGVEERFGFEVARIERSDDGFIVRSREGGASEAGAVIVASGGGVSVLEGLGHTREPLWPVLVPLATDTRSIRGLSGVRVRCAGHVLDSTGARVASERGELLFRDYGVSGIMVLDLSRVALPGSTLSLDYFPDIDLPGMEQLLAERIRTLGWRSAGTFFNGMLHTRIAQAVLRAAEVPLDASAASLDARALARLLKDFRLAITGTGDAAQAQVTRGGARLDGFDPSTMESRLAPGVFAAGEVLDVDGRCGGFNLHWAWASGIVAGRRAAAHTAEPPA
ncbi:MAG: aminoacetone oxidase family FAD-binding enzyme [Coriobacteriia bacterium]|nr:aminoacetone oxidase family FAD-binding enzyme [Coriobacteriia bacterium]MBN2840829.1 aminoacetone oxidase family FAD-binding enzyme [Coriobacteriia bacterium]